MRWKRRNRSAPEGGIILPLWSRQPLSAEVPLGNPLPPQANGSGDSLFYVGHFNAVKLYPILETLLCRAAYPAQILLGTHAQVGQWSNSLAGPAFPLFASVSEKALVPPPAVACPPCPCGPRIYMRVPSRPPASHPILCFPVDQCLTNCKAVYGWLGKRTGRDGKRRR